MKALSIRDISHIMTSLAEYRDLGNYLPQLSPKSEKLEEFCKQGGEPWYKSNMLKRWDEIDIHVINQTWGSTSCGWGGMGGSAMSDKYNIVIENAYHRAYYVYWDRKLAYILRNDKSINLRNLPSLSDVSKNEFFIYKNERR